MGRVTGMIATVLCVAASSIGAGAWAQSASAPVAVVSGGSIRGRVIGGDVKSYLGVPYAAPPVGDLRWKSPQPVVGWEGVREATQFGHRCTQFGVSPDMQFRDAGPSEDCLTLNVWAPMKAEKLPVMVWVHGGGFVNGGSSEPRQDGQFLTKHGVIVVSMNYRLGMLGFFTHKGLEAESEHQSSGNYGLMDQAAAVAWVKQNIAAFGGDPGNITLFGESAGSFSVSALMASPVSKGMLAKAIGESGSPLYNRTLSFKLLADREVHDAEVAKTVLGTDNLAALRKMPAESFADEKKLQPATLFPPVIDGYFLPKPVAAIYAAGEQAHIPMMAGWNADEIRGTVVNAKVKTTSASFAATADKDFGADAKAFLAVYPAKTNAEAEQSAGDYAGDKFLVYSTWRWLEAQVKTGEAPVYRYRLDLVPPTDKYHPAGSGAFHSDDIEYVFGTLDSRQQATWRPVDRAVSKQIQTYWTNFAKTGDPNGKELDGKGLPKWPAYDAKDGWMLMHLDAKSTAKRDELRERYLFLDGGWGQ